MKSHLESNMLHHMRFIYLFFFLVKKKNLFGFNAVKEFWIFLRSLKCVCLLEWSVLDKFSPKFENEDMELHN